MDTTHVGVRRHNIHNIQIVLATQWFFWVISLALPRGSKRLTMDRSAEADARAPGRSFFKVRSEFLFGLWLTSVGIFRSLPSGKLACLIPPVTSGLAIPPVRLCSRDKTEQGASRKSFAGAHASTAVLGMPEEGSRVRALYAYSQIFRWIGVPKTRRSLPEPLVRRQAPFGPRRFPASPRSLEESIGKRVGFP